MENKLSLLYLVLLLTFCSTLYLSEDAPPQASLLWVWKVSSIISGLASCFFSLVCTEKVLSSQIRWIRCVVERSNSLDHRALQDGSCSCGGGHSRNSVTRFKSPNVFSNQPYPRRRSTLCTVQNIRDFRTSRMLNGAVSPKLSAVFYSAGKSRHLLHLTTTSQLLIRILQRIRNQNRKNTWEVI